MCPSCLVWPRSSRRSVPELSNGGLQDVDAVITTRELARMIKEAGIDFVNLPDESFDAMLGESTGAADIFGATGGVMEAALRTVADILEGKDLDNIEYTAVRGIEGVKEASVTIAGKEIKLAVANGTGNAKILMEKMKNGEADYTFIEVMGCPGGCVTGGGQPIVPARNRMKVDPAWCAPRRSTPRTSPRSSASLIRMPLCRSCTRITSASPTATRRMSCCIPTMWIAPASKV